MMCIPGFEDTLAEVDELCAEAHEIVERRKAKLKAEQEAKE